MDDAFLQFEAELAALAPDVGVALGATAAGSSAQKSGIASTGDCNVSAAPAVKLAAPPAPPAKRQKLVAEVIQAKPVPAAPPAPLLPPSSTDPLVPTGAANGPSQTGKPAPSPWAMPPGAHFPTPAPRASTGMNMRAGAGTVMNVGVHGGGSTHLGRGPVAAPDITLAEQHSQQQSAYEYGKSASVPSSNYGGASGSSNNGAVNRPGQNKQKKFTRIAAGQSWEDPTLAKWPENDFRIFVGDLGNEVSDDMVANAFSGYVTCAFLPNVNTLLGMS